MAGASGATQGTALRIGDVAALTSATPRMLRHYENQGLIAAERSSAGQRLFDPSVVEQVRSIRWLLGAGLPVEAIRELLDCIHDTDRLEPCAVPLLVEHLQAYDGRIAELTTTRDALQGLIDASNG
ncbi:MerR family transcriptional regulator [Micromonospora sagamiensis]|uniref:DNA-binding transcriptional MerR regulator n=1 Tax=Micromonospora sagamiensis TaxID=47875 RepID=A0A562WPI4_9ACTN|nr:MerR family transcriptional regulator [Micromonospora sagamiensis]TWJ32243.1 DNA-binding transcriptional MerR regulator [Micromonospora sagamiensis]BCL14698.1 Cu(I)-responsive transcriptional regulator [Micromonospora sagamiensis]